MNSTRFLLKTLITVWIASISGITSAETEIWTPESVFAFANHLEQEGDFFRAITEYHRVIFHWPDHPLAIESQFRIGLSHLSQDDPESALSTFQDMLALSSVNSTNERIRLGLARAYFNLSKWDRADQQLDILERSGTVIPRSSIQYNRLWCRLKPGLMDEALRFWRSESLTNGSMTGKSHNEIHDVLMEFSRTPYKHPELAGALSAAIPGLGQVYTGRWRDGLISFLVNGLFIGAIAVAIDRGHDESAAVLGFFELGFYSANIYNAVNDAHKKNRDQLENNLHRFEYRFGSPFEIP